MALEELPYRRRGIDFAPRPGVTEAVDANQSDLGALGAPVVAHRRQRTRWIVEDDFRLAFVAIGPTSERVGHTLLPFRSSTWCMPSVRVLRVGQPMERQHWNRRTGTRRGKPEPG